MLDKEIRKKAEKLMNTLPTDNSKGLVYEAFKVGYEDGKTHAIQSFYEAISVLNNYDLDQYFFKKTITDKFIKLLKDETDETEKTI